MARMPRVVALNVPHHITQRGNARQFLLATPEDRNVYLDLLQEYSSLHRLSVLGFCIMSNHVHLVAIPHLPDSLATALKQTHGRYAAYWNARNRSNGHAWQGRFYSCPLDLPHLWLALRYIERNPVRAGLVAEAPHWIWSSAMAHTASSLSNSWISLDLWRHHWNPTRWQNFLRAGESEQEQIALLRSTHSGRPLGDTAFLHRLESRTGRKLAARKGGHPFKNVPAN